MLASPSGIVLKMKNSQDREDQTPFVVAELHKKAELFAERNKLYGDNYKRFGKIMSLILAGQTIDTNDERALNRLGILFQIVAKITRYGENFSRGGHDDSLDDNSVYSMMLKELDHAE